MSTEELARALGISPSALMQDRYQRSDCIPYIKIGRRVRYLRDDVCRYMASHRLGGQGSASNS